MSVELIRRGQSQIYGQVGVGLRGQTWINLADAGDTSPQTVENLGAAKTYLLINSEGANVEIDTVDTPTPVKLTGETSFDFVWSSGKIALYELSTAETALDASALGTIYHYVNGFKPSLAARIVSQNTDETVESIAYIPAVGRSLPNGVYDEIDIVTGKRTQRVSGEYTLGGSEVWAYNSAYNGETTAYFITNLLDNLALVDPTTPNNSIVVSGYPKGMVWATDNACIDLLKTAPKLRIRVLKSELESLSAAGLNTWLRANPITLTYQLATPVETYIDPQPLQIFPNGNRWVEHANKEVAVYNTGIHVANTDLPIKEMIKVDKVGLLNGRWYREPIDLADVTIAIDGLSFTIDGATSGAFEQYEFAYYYDSALSTLPELVIPDEPSLVTIKNRNISL